MTWIVFLIIGILVTLIMLPTILRIFREDATAFGEAFVAFVGDIVESWRELLSILFK